MKHAHITIHADGACLGNPGPGGWAAVVRRYVDGEQIKRREISGACLETTNNRMELSAALQGLQQIKRDEVLSVIIHSDSQYLVHGMTEWSQGWVASNWKTSNGKPVANRDLWESLLAACAGLSVEWRWVKGHSGDPRNEEADRLASQAADKARARS